MGESTEGDAKEVAEKIAEMPEYSADDGVWIAKELGRGNWQPVERAVHISRSEREGRGAEYVLMYGGTSMKTETVAEVDVFPDRQSAQKRCDSLNKPCPRCHDADGKPLPVLDLPAIAPIENGRYLWNNFTTDPRDYSEHRQDLPPTGFGILAQSHGVEVIIGKGGKVNEAKKAARFLLGFGASIVCQAVGEAEANAKEASEWRSPHA
jgi:hypothetical protein